MKKYIVGALIVIIGLLVLLAPFGFAHVCFPKADGSFMKCHWMGEAVRMLGGLITALGIIFLLSKRSRIGIAFSNIGLGTCLILLQTVVIGTCKHAAMHCNVHTKPVILLLAIILIVINAAYLFVNRKR
ncbi:DUF4418 family protein [Treponema medium]|uniref:DUF4418 domain-containing protein n=2 Tax=Treponema medium TaxID=58231 RepID=A0AA87NNM1_TREMD|nr:DUF4418 family protein [Treponema medium]EPF27920.1 hypothetical protein HMPREF9195_02051 [Treponema medium ATCC 700293]QSH98151.1 DUF4418 family protein [Treponema medium]